MSGTAAKWDCDNDITALSNRGPQSVCAARDAPTVTRPSHSAWWIALIQRFR